MDYGLNYEKAPEIWDAIAQATLSIKSSLISNTLLKNTIVPLAQSGYKGETFWKEIKDLVIEHSRHLDLLTMLEIRNQYVLNFSHEKAFISFIEQKSINTLFYFGKSSKSQIFPGSVSSRYSNNRKEAI